MSDLPQPLSEPRKEAFAALAMLAAVVAGTAIVHFPLS
jgi:hypothetical protein